MTCWSTGARLEKFLVVVNASNDDKDWAWLNAVREGKVCVDAKNAPAPGLWPQCDTAQPARPPSRRRYACRYRPARADARGISCWLWAADAETRKRIMALKRTELCEAVVGGFDLVVSRTGYTGEKMAFELFVHPERAEAFFQALLKAGEPFGLKPIGLGARDSLRTEAGLPLYGHEMGCGSGKLGAPDLGVAEGGFGCLCQDL